MKTYRARPVVLLILGLGLAASAAPLACGPGEGALRSDAGSAGGGAATDAAGSGGAASDAGIESGGSTGGSMDAASSSDGGATSADATSSAGLCPDLPVPATCFNRSVVYREWGPAAKGDYPYFAAEAPERLSFNRVHGAMWIVKFHVEANTYAGAIAASVYGGPGTLWISDDPCNPTFAIANGTLAVGSSGGGVINFVVARDDVDADKLHSDPMYKSQFAKVPQLRGDHCYYAVYENTVPPPAEVTADYLATSPDPCGDAVDPSCHYLLLDFAHLLHDPTTGQSHAGEVIPGLTIP